MDTSPIDIPDDVIEVILSKSHIKSVVRFKSVSKSWQSIISDPRFSRTHRIHRSELSENHNKFMLLAPETMLGAHIYLIRWEEDGIFRTESVLPYPSYIFNYPLCSYNGLILFGKKGNNQHFMLWNPSIGTHIMITGPHVAHSIWLCQFYYDSMSDDHKIVFVYEKCYTVYSCNNGNWSDLKDLPCDPRLIIGLRGASVDGCFYGLVGNGEIVCFDTRDGNLHKFQQPNDVRNDKGLKMWAMEKHGSFQNKSLMKWCGDWTWKKLISMEKEEVAYLCLTNNARFAIRTKKLSSFGGKSRIFPYSENLYMPCSNILAP